MMKRIFFSALAITCLYVDGWLLASDRLIWWTFPSHLLAISGMIVFSGLAIYSWKE